MRSPTASITKSRPAYTLIDVMLTLAILAIAMSVTLPFLGLFRQSQTLEIQTRDVVQTLRDAQRRAQTGRLDRDWGVRFQTGSFLLFAGSGFVERMRAADDVHAVNASFSFSGSTDVVFRKITGAPLSPGTVSIVLGSERRDVSVNRVGGIDAH